MTEPPGGEAPSCEKCLGLVREAAAGFTDARKGRNTSHTVPDAVMSAFAVFFLQSPSWLSCQRAMRDEKGRSNALTLFGIGSVPTDNRVRSLLDPSGPELLHGAFRGLLGLLEGCGALERYRVLGGRTLVALDGTDFHSSEKISCPDCLVTRHRESHKAAYGWLDLLEPGDFRSVSETRREADGHKRTWAVRFAKGVPLSGEDGAPRVNWIGLTVTDAKGRQTCRNNWATDLEADAGNAVEPAACGRSRWTIENGNNTLKTKGCHLGHNFGHGKEHLADTLASLNILAFLTRTALELAERQYRLIRDRLGSRRELFLHLHVLTVYHLFASRDDFEDSVMKAHRLGPHAPAAPPELTSKGLIRRYAKRKSR